MAELNNDIQHLYRRAGFGLNWKESQQLSTHSQAQHQIFSSSRAYTPLQGADSFPHQGQMGFRNMSPTERKEAVEANRKSLTALNVAWLRHMSRTEGQLREKMAFFWHDHFACKLNVYKAAQIQQETLRKHALGNFGDLLHAMAKDPGMLLFLNNQQNKKSHPNENFARELLELFTLGRGNYTEEDVKEAARAFTGWATLPNGKFFFRRRLHDPGKKTFLGRRGNFGGEDILNILLEERQTARQIVRKLYRFFINPKEDPYFIDLWASHFYESGYDLEGLLKKMLRSAHFYEDRNRNVRIKSPVEYLVGIMRLLEADFEHLEGWVFLQKTLGQMLFFPPSVAGWPEGRAWIDGSTLITRLKFPSLLAQKGGLEVMPKAAFAGNEEFLGKFTRKDNLSLYVPWPKYLKYVAEMPVAERSSWLSTYILPGMDTQHLLADSPLATDAIQEATLHLIATPEFQLC